MNARARPEIPAALQVAGVARRYGSLEALRGVDIHAAPGEILCLLGSSGCGKSTLLRLIAGLEMPDAGSIRMDGVALSDAHHFVPPERRGIGLVFQDYALFPHLSLLDNVAFGLRQPRASRESVAREALARVRLEQRASSFPHMLSGGEQQRVALARALAPRPRLLLMDEPFSNLDRGLRESVRAEALDILREEGITAIIVTHDPEEALRIADRIVLMRAGSVEQDAVPEVLYRQPASLYAARFFTGLVELEAGVQQGQVATPLGTFPAHGLPDGKRAIVALRPHELQLAPAGTAARVQERIFLGASLQLRLGVEGLAAPLLLNVAASCTAMPGDTVHLATDTTAALVYGAA